MNTMCASSACSRFDRVWARWLACCTDYRLSIQVEKYRGKRYWNTIRMLREYWSLELLLFFLCKPIFFVFVLMEFYKYWKVFLWIFIKFVYLKNITLFFSFLFYKLESALKAQNLERRYDNFSERLRKKRRKEEANKINEYGGKRGGGDKIYTLWASSSRNIREIDKNKSRGIFMEVISGKEESNDTYVWERKSV